MAADVGDVRYGIEAEFALDGYVPDVGFGLRGLLVDVAGERWEGAGADCGAGWVVCAAACDRDYLLQRCEAAEEYVVGGALTAGVAAEAGAENRLGVERIGYANARLEEELLHVDVAARKIVEEVVVLAGHSDWDVSGCAGGKAVAEENGSVEWVAAASDWIACCGVDLHCSSGVVEGGVEGSGVVPDAVEGVNAGVSHTELEVEFRRDLPGVLREELDTCWRGWESRCADRSRSRC